MFAKGEHLIPQVNPLLVEIREFPRQLGKDPQTAPFWSGEVLSHHPGEQHGINLSAPCSGLRPYPVEQLLIPLNMACFIGQMSALREHEAWFEVRCVLQKLARTEQGSFFLDQQDPKEKREDSRMPHPLPKTNRTPCRHPDEMKIAPQVMFREAIPVQFAKHLRVLRLFLNECSKSINKPVRR